MAVPRIPHPTRMAAVPGMLARLALACGLLPVGTQAQVVAANLVDLSLEQLTSIQVTSVGKRPQRLADVSATVFVINAEDIRRSGATSLPEVLRLAPNLQVARADANQYAITARGFNSVLANKMLVLVDGRTVYSPLFSGVFWEAQDVMLEDIERIEVLSGPGGTLYGSNAVNGVINIISRSAADTGGTLVAAGAGNKERTLALRHGAESAGGIHWRLYARRVLRDNTALANGTPVRDAAGHSQLGFRADQGDAAQQFTVQGDIYQARIDQAPSARTLRGVNLLGRWSRQHGGVRSQVQAYVDRAERDQPGSVRDRLDTLDLEFQQLSLLAGHDLIWGAGYRLQHDRVENLAPAAFGLLPGERRLRLGHVFVQDDLALAGGFKLTLGLKAEHNSYTGLEWLPNARLAKEVAPNHLVWGAVSRTVRTPARLDKEYFSPATPPFAIAGGPDFLSEVARVAEIGYRGQPVPAVSYSVSLYHHDFQRLRSVDVAAGTATANFNNNFSGRLNGLTAWGQWRAGDRWRVNASYVNQRQRFEAAPGTAPLGGVASLGNDPRTRASLGLAWDLAAHMEVDLQLRRTGALPNPAVPAYTALDMRWGWRVRPDLELSVAARNLGDARHPEWGNAANRAEIARSVMLKAEWRL